MNIINVFKKKPGVYCEDCKYYIHSKSLNEHPYFSNCARLSKVVSLQAPRVVRVMQEYRHNQSCVEARKNAGDCGEQGKYWEERDKDRQVT